MGPMPDRLLSTTEYTILGIVGKAGPCTTYAVMKELASSGSSYYKDRAGTTYPVVERLLKRGLIEAGENRRSRKLRITIAGKEELKKWLTPPLPDHDVAHTLDLIRLRMYFLAALDEKQQELFVDRALDSLKRHLANTEELIEQERAAGDRIGSLATLGLLFETKARIAWLEAIKPQLLS